MNDMNYAPSLLPKGPKGTLAVTIRYSGFVPGGEIALASVTSQSMDRGVAMISLPTTRGCESMKASRSCRRAIAEARSTKGSSAVFVMLERVEVRTTTTLISEQVHDTQELESISLVEGQTDIRTTHIVQLKRTIEA